MRRRPLVKTRTAAGHPDGQACFPDAAVEDSLRRTALVAAALLPVLALTAFGVVELATDEPAETAAGAAKASILNPHPAAGPFTADDTELDDCVGEATDQRLCLEQAFGNVAYRTSGKEALALMASREAAQPEVAAGCHRIAHAIGAAVLAREDGDAASALAEGDSTCWSGFYHGLLERALAPARSADELGRLIATLCEPRGKSWPQFTRYQCLHGLGHGLMLRTGNARRALAGDVHPARRPVVAPVLPRRGVHGELQPVARPEAAAVRRCRSARAVPVRRRGYKLYCYLQVADNLVRGFEYDWPAVARACETEPAAEWREICFQSYGRQASGSNYGEPAARRRAVRDRR